MTTAYVTDEARMDAETAVEHDERADGGGYGLIEVGVDANETVADLHIEDGDNPQAVTLRLSADEIRSLIASLERALETVEANS
jgi:hypothetical protein